MDENFQNAPVPEDEARWESYSSRTRKIWRLLGGLVVVGILVCLFLPAKQHNGGTPRSTCANNLRNINMALIHYRIMRGAYPPAYTVDANGKPLHSWRTLILPYLDRNDLYQSIDLSKPWDDPVNAKAAKMRIACYRCPSANVAENYTTYLAIVTPHSCLQPGKSKNIDDIKDDASQTLAVIEVDADHAVPWMRRSTPTKHWCSVAGSVRICHTRAAPMRRGSMVLLDSSPATCPPTNCEP